ncbi:MAG: DUF4034 domain-containing protein, partial [Thermoplasmata archaeon]
IDDYIKWVPLLYQKKDFNEIEKHIYGLLRDNNEAKSYELYVLYHVLAKITDNKHIDLMQSVLNEWCSKHAGSHIPWLTRGVFYIDHAWTIRGSGLAKSVPKKAWPKFYEKLKLAQKDLEKSWELNPNDPNSSCNLIVVAKGLNYPRERMEQYYENAISACPWHFGVRFKKLQYLKPKWHGSSEEMFEFAEQCLISSEQYPYLGLIMVNVLEEAHKYNSKKENILGKDNMWPTIEKIYAAFFAKYPEDIRRRFYYAYHAYKTEKYEVALNQFEIIGDRWMENTCWYSFGYYNDCRSIAYIKRGEEFFLKKNLYEISIDYFQKAVKYDPNDYAYYRLGQAYMYSGICIRDLAYIQKAEKTLKKAIELRGPNSKYAKDELKKLRKYLRKH